MPAQGTLAARIYSHVRTRRISYGPPTANRAVLGRGRFRARDALPPRKRLGINVVTICPLASKELREDEPADVRGVARLRHVVIGVKSASFRSIARSCRAASKRSQVDMKAGMTAADRTGLPRPRHESAVRVRTAESGSVAHPRPTRRTETTLCRIPRFSGEPLPASPSSKSQW